METTRAQLFRRAALLCLACLTLCAARSGLAAETNSARFCPSLVAACEAAQEDQSLVLLVFVAQGSEPCVDFRKNTLEQESFLKKAGGLKIVLINVDSDPNAAERFKVREIPNLVLLNADLKIAARRSGNLDPAGLLAWIEQGRAGAARGEWEGSAPDAEVTRRIAAATERGTLDADEIRSLIQMLDDPDPASRAAVEKAVLAQRERAVAPLIEMVTNSFLGLRVEASLLLRQLAPDSPEIDPWQAPADLAPTMVALGQWWSKTGGQLSKASAPGASTSEARTLAGRAIEKARGSDLAARSEGMTTLLRAGEAALPAIREAIGACEKSGDHGGALALEDVRWAILIPDALESRAGSLRRTLARGSSSDRQSAANRLAKGGREAIPALAELASDADALVVESAVRALSEVGGKDAVPAMSALLKAADSNLRMTAAQALGHAGAKAANAALAEVVDDPNEVVACAAVAALEEINEPSDVSDAKPDLPDEVSQALAIALKDTRWRVRAAASEAAGKLSAQTLSAEVKALLNDADGIVVKSAMTALSLMQKPVAADELEAIGRRLPSLRPDVVSLLMASGAVESAKTIASMFAASAADGQLAILGAMMPERQHSASTEAEPWSTVLAKAAASADPRVRRRAVEILETRPASQALDAVAGLLEDEDPQTRLAAARLALCLASGQGNAEADDSGEEEESGSKKAAKNKTLPPETVAAWHQSLLKRSELATNAFYAAALYATGKSPADLALLNAALKNADAKEFSKPAQVRTLGAVLSLLPIPGGEGILSNAFSNPLLYAEVAAASATNPASVYLRDKARFKTALEPVDQMDSILKRLLRSSSGPQGWSLLTQDAATAELISALCESTNAGLRAAAVYAASKGKIPGADALCERALRDPNSETRAEAVRGFFRCGPDRQKLESTLGPLLGETNQKVAHAAAAALIDPDILSAASLEDSLWMFSFGDVKIYSTRSSSGGERPLAVMATKPPYLADARARFLEHGAANAGVFMLLLAQHGEFDALDKTIELNPKPFNRGASATLEPLLAAISLSKDAKYIPFIRAASQGMKDEDSLRTLLRAVKSMSGPEARQIRLDINKQIRSSVKE